MTNAIKNFNLKLLFKYKIHNLKKNNKNISSDSLTLQVTIKTVKIQDTAFHFIDYKNINTKFLSSRLTIT